MTHWPIIQVDTVCDVTSSKRIYAKELSASGVPFYRSKEIIEKLAGQRTPSTPLFISEQRFQEIVRQTGAPIEGDLLLTSRGTLGLPYLVTATDRFHFADGNLTWFRHFKGLDSAFLKYFFLSPAGKAELARCVIGSSQPAYTIAALKKISIPMPPLSLQRRIAGLLLSYDDLIEINRRRITLLAEMARRLFEEWFVRFRFPSRAEMSQNPNGPLPAGWSFARLSDVLSTLEAGSRPKGGIKDNDGDVPSIGAENINGLANYDFGKEKLIPRDFFSSMRRGVIQSGDVLLYKDGAHIGRKAMFRDNYPHSQCAVNEHVFILRPKLPITSHYLYFWLDQPHMTSKIKALNSNAAQPGLNQAGVNSLPILIPNSSVLAHYTELVEPMLALLFNSAKANRLLSSARDMLLPRLISGELTIGVAERELEAAE